MTTVGLGDRPDLVRAVVVPSAGAAVGVGSPRFRLARFVTATLARSTMALLAVLLFWAAAPAVLGWHPTTVMTGSMEPGIRPGDVVVAMPVARRDLEPERVVLVDDPDQPGRLRLHRLVGRTADGDLVLRGDANREADSTPVAPDHVHGVGVIRVPAIGLPVLWAAEGRLLPLVLAAGGLGGLAMLTGIDRDLRNGHRLRVRVSRRRAVAHAAVPVLLLALGTGAVAHGSGAAFLARTVSTGSTWTSGSFACVTHQSVDSPYLSYDFADTGSSTVTDGSGNARHGTLLAGASRGSGRCTDDRYLTLDGSANSVVTTPQMSVASPAVFSLETWFRTTSQTGGVLISNGSSTNTAASTSYDRVLFMSKSGALSFGIYNGAVRQVTSKAAGYNDGSWHHVVASWTASGGTLFVDGVQDNTIATGSTPESRTNGYWRIGYETLSANWTSQVSNFHFSGSLDDTAIYAGTALTAAQVKSHYDADR